MEHQQQQATDNSFRFACDNVEICKEVPEFLLTAQEVMQNFLGITKKFEDFSHRDNSSKVFIPGAAPGLLLAVHRAYGAHYPLKLSVSDFLILIGQGLGRHINQNAEGLRKYFVEHEGKEVIRIFRDEFVKGRQNDWSTVFGEFADEIKKRVKTDIYDVIIDDTSVATPTTRIVSEITLMGAMKEYFDLRVKTRCGIPQIILEGTPDDWRSLKDKVEKLVGMNKEDCLKLKWWLDVLVPVVNKICEAGMERKADVEFWSKIYKSQGGSGGPYITGWILNFFPYFNKRVNNFKYGMVTSSDVPNQVSDIPFIWEYFEENIPMRFYGGFMGAEFDIENCLVKPAYFWSVNYEEENQENLEGS